jgi:hypothetical protein
MLPNDIAELDSPGEEYTSNIEDKVDLSVYGKAIYTHGFSGNYVLFSGIPIAC